jgi:glycosyltransferase involved in cell wall biosynthesis
MKRIGIDARLYFQTGVGVYIRNLLYYLQQIAPSDIEFYIYVMREDSSRITLSNKRFIKREVDIKWHTLSEQLSLYSILYHDKLDLMHFTYFSYPVMYRRNFIATIHDTILYSFKTGMASTKNRLWYEVKHTAFKFALQNQLVNATKIITPTQTVRNELMTIFGKKYGDKIIPIYEGIDKELIQATEDSELQKKFKKSFFLYVGNFYPHKNVERLLEAFEKLEADVDLVLRGPDDFFKKRIEQVVQQKGLKHRVHFYTSYTHASMVFFYKNARALIHPSLVEGFGLPLVEAAYYNTPIIASDIPVFKELLGDEYVPFDPKSSESMLEAIRMFLQKPCICNYEKVVNKFSFIHMVEETLKVYETCL